MDAVPCLVWMSNEHSACNYFNHAWLDFRGRTLAQEINGGWADGIHPDDLGNVVRQLELAVQTHSVVTLEYRLRQGNGDYRWILDRSAPRHSRLGVFQGYIGTCLDITEKKRAEQEILRLNSSLEQRVLERTADLEQARNDANTANQTSPFFWPP